MKISTSSPARNYLLAHPVLPPASTIENGYDVTQRCCNSLGSCNDELPDACTVPQEKASGHVLSMFRVEVNQVVLICEGFAGH